MGTALKAQRLQELQDLGLRVPAFAVITAEQASSFSLPEHLQSCRRFAVRSNAFAEDSDQSSHAGQFKTLLDVSPEQLNSAIQEVIANAGGAIIQEYIDADMAGVAFTRNPLGGREMIIEYHKGRGEEVVGGKIKPERRILQRGQKQAEVFDRIEKHYGHPQDIEWCVKDGVWYYLQTRPITTISSQEYQSYLYLDSVLPRDRDFLYEKTAISEMAPRPSEFMLDLLHKIYAHDGPVAKVYATYGVVYEARDFLKLIGGELYIDREEELKTLLPSYSYFPLREKKPHFKMLTGLLRTVKNISALQKISLERWDALSSQLKEKLNSKLGDFLKDYEVIFEANVLSEKAMGKVPLEKIDQLRGDGQLLTLKYFSSFNMSFHNAPEHDFTLPPLLASAFFNDDKKPLLVSPGNASGILVTEDQIAHVEGDKILHTAMLTPDLARYFSQIKGIVSEQGGMLSHLAILAREQKIPVMVNIDLKKAGLHLGDPCTITSTPPSVSSIASGGFRFP